MVDVDGDRCKYDAGVANAHNVEPVLHVAAVGVGVDSPEDEHQGGVKGGAGGEAREEGLAAGPLCLGTSDVGGHGAGAIPVVQQQHEVLQRAASYRGQTSACV